MLAALLLFLGLAVRTHALVTTVRRDRHQFALLRSIGFARAQIRAVVTWQAVAMTGTATVVGTALGVVAGRLLWRRFADDLGLTPHAVVPVVGVAAAALVALVVAVGVGRWCVGRATREPIGRTLHAE